MNNINKSLSINETYIIDSVDGSDIFSACTALYTNNIISCSGNTQIDLGDNLIVFNGNTLATIISATTYYGDGSNLTGISTQDTFVTGGTYSNGTAVFTNNTGGTFSVTGFYTGSTTPFDVFVTGGTYSAGIAIFTNNTGGTFSVTGFSVSNATQFTGGTVTGATFFNAGLSATTISATTYLGLPITTDIFVTGGTYSDGTAVFENNTGGTFSVTGFTTSQNLQQVTDGVGNNITTNDIIVTGATGTDILISSQFDSSQITVTDGTASVSLAAQNSSTTSESLIQLTSDTGYGLIYPTGAQFSEVTGGVVNISPDMLELSSVANPIIRLITSSGDTSIKTDLITTSNLEQQLPDKSGTFAMLSDLTNVVNLVTVGLTGSTGVDYNSVKEAVDSITGASASNTFVVKVGPGVFYEDPITMKSYVDVVGESETNTIIQANNPNLSLIIGADQSMINNVQIQGCTGTGVAAVVYSSSTTPQLNAIFYVENVRFGANYTHAKTVGTGGGNCIMQCSNVKYGGYPFTLGFYVTNDGSGVGRMQLRNVTSTNGGVTTTSGLVFAKADQPSCAFIVNGALLTKSVGAPAGIGFWIENGGVLRATSVNFQRWSTAIYAPQTGSAPSIDGLALNFEGCTTDVNIIHSGATGKIQGTDNYVKTLINIDAPLYEVNQDPRIITVAKKGGDFTSVKSAVDSITGSSINNRFLISVGPGKFSENEIDLTGKPYVSIVGNNIITTQIVPNTNTQHIFKIGQNNEISFLALSGAPIGYAAIYINDIGDYAQAHKISFTDCDTNVWLESHTQDTIFYGEYLDFNGEYSYGTKIIAYNGYSAYANMENYYNLPTGTGTTIGNHIQGSGATLSAFVADGIGNGVSGSTNYQILDYGSLNTISTTADNWDYGIRVLNIGGPSRFDVDSYSVVNSLVWDLSIEHPDTFGTFGGGSASHAKINNLSNDVYWAFLDIEDGEFDITRKISITFQDGTHTDVSTLVFEGSTMGLFDGGVITHVSGLTFEVSSGFGYLEKTIGDGIHMRIDWLPTQITLLPNTENYLYFNENEILSSSGSAPDDTNNIVLGRVVTDSSTVRFIDSSPYIAAHTSNLFSNFNRSALGPIYSTGSIVTENVTPYHLNISSGDYYYSENNFKPSGGTDVSFIQYYRDNLTGWTTTGTTEVVNGYDDNSGTISPLPLSSFTKHSLYVVGEGINETYMLVLGQATYSTLVEAEGAELPSPPNYFDDSVAPIASILIQQGMSGITEIQDIRPVIGFKAAGVSASAVHANLLGLSADDHTQYLLVDGNRAMSGNLSMGGNAIFSALTVNGVTVESHASRHKNGGADEIATATPAPSEIPKADSFGKLDGWISDASTTVKGLTRLSTSPASASVPIAVGVNDTRFLNSISGVTNTTPSLIFRNNSGGTTTISNLRMSGLTATTISATTYQNLPTDIRVTGGTYSSGVGQATFRNNTGGTFNVGGFFRPADDIYVSGGTIGNGPDVSNNKIILNRNNASDIDIFNLVDIVNVNRNTMTGIINDRNVIRGKTYKISKCDTSLYYNGSFEGNDIYTDIYLMGLEGNILSESGIGVFYTPKYDVYPIYIDNKPYDKNEIVIWGGYIWNCTKTGTYSSIDIFTLDPSGFSIKLPFDGGGEFNSELYNIQYDDIIYDYTNDKITYRNEQNSNIVSTTTENTQYWEALFGYNPIKVFQWGNVYTNIGGKISGIGNQTIINSYNENINYAGKYQKDFYFNNLSYQINNYVITNKAYQELFYFDNKSYQNNISLTNTAYQKSLYFLNSSYQDNIAIDTGYQENIILENQSYIDTVIIDNNSYQSGITLNNESYLTNLTLSSDSSYQKKLTFNNQSYQDDIFFGNSCYQENFNFNNGSYLLNNNLINDGKFANQSYFNFDNGSYQENINLNSVSQQFFDFTNQSYQLNIDSDVSQENLIFDTGSQYNTQSYSQSNITIKNYNRDLSTQTAAEGNLFFIHNLPSVKTEKFIGKIGNQLIEVDGLTYDGSQFLFTQDIGGYGTLTFGTISASSYLGLPLDIRVTGGTYNSGTSTITFRNNTGGTFNVTGITATGSSFTGGTVSGATRFINGLTANTFSATTYQNLPTGTTVGSFGITIDGAGSVITTGVKGYSVLPYNAIITGWDIVGDVVGSCVIDVWKASSGTIPTVANTITGTEKPTLSTQQINSDNNLTSWTTNVSLGDVIAFNVDSATTVKRVNLIIKVIKI